METIDLSNHDIAPRFTRESILNRVDDLLIFRYYIGEFTLGKRRKSPFRDEKHASFSVTWNPHWGQLQFKDFTNGAVGSCFKLVSLLKGISDIEAVQLIARDFGLLEGTPLYSPEQISQAKEFKERAHEEASVYIVEVRSQFSQAELAFWQSFNITREDLKRFCIYPIKKLWINDGKITLPGGLHFAYHFPKVGKWKIYSPLSQTLKWSGNVSGFEMEGVVELIPSVYEPLIITKSRKDRIILSKLYPNVCSSQNEAETAIPLEMDTKFDSMYPAGKFVWYDSDEPGKTASIALNSRGYGWINVPNDLYETLNLKDPGDVIKHLGWTEGAKILRREISRKTGLIL